MRIYKLVTIKEVSELAQVSQATVSRAINGHSSVQKKNKLKVLAAIKELGYKPNAVAQALASNRSNSIGMLVGSLDGPYYGPLMHNVESTIRKHNLHFVVTSGLESQDRETNSINFLQSKRVDGLVIHADQLSDDELIQVVKETPATIILNRYVPELALQCITINNELGGYIATKHLLENGHTRVACITGQMSKIDSRDRLQGYRNAITEFGLKYDPDLIIEGRFDHQGNAEVIDRLFERKNGMTAVFCQNDHIALKVYDACNERNLKVGEDISIVGFDNHSYCQYINPKLTTMNLPIVEMGNEAAIGLLALLKKKPHSLKTNLTPELICRDSVKNLNE
mgnify:CR=1 FL=1|tara:strand:- start:17184 stop:18200 length:1017 start_codon:yes stop_codon:yes gene_type:complete